MKQEELNQALRLHKMWLNDEEGDQNANLTIADLRGANLRYLDLRSADFRGANLISANLRYVDLRGANLIGANLRGADLTGADLRDANLTGAKLTSADLRGADLRGANLTGANLTGAKTESAMIPTYCKWHCCIIDTKIKIGCKTKSIEEWDAFFASDKEYQTKRSTDDFIRIEAVYNSYKAYLETFNTKEK